MDSLSPLVLLVEVLAVWRLTSLLQREDGPGGILSSLRARLGTGMAGALFGCFYCLSLWVALPVALTHEGGWRSSGLLWLALSGGAILLERATLKDLAPLYEEAPLEEPELAAPAEVHHEPV